MTCQIVPGFALDSVPVGGSWSVSLTTIPVESQITWSGDLGDAFLLITDDGHQIEAAWKTAGEKVLTAKCENAQTFFTIIVKECAIFFLRVNPKTTFRFDEVVIEAETAPRATAENPSRKLEWSGELGIDPQFIGNALLTAWDFPGVKNVTASVCDGSDTSTTQVFVKNETMSEANKQRIKDAYDIRKKAKEDAARASVALNDEAVLLGLAGITLGTLTGGAGLVVVAGVGSFGSWYGGNRFSELAIDPPRTDFDVVSRFEELSINFPAARDQVGATVQALISGVVSLAVCTSRLIRSLERVDGLIMSPGNDDTLPASPFFPLQTSAVEHNANAAANLIDKLLMKTGDINASWEVLLGILDKEGLNSQTSSLQEIKDRLSDSFEHQKTDLEEQLGLPPEDFQDLTTSVQVGISSFAQRPPLPRLLFDETKIQVLGDLSGSLRSLASAYERLGA